MGQPVDDEQIGQLGTQFVIGLCLEPLRGFREMLGLLYRVGREERGVVAVFAHGQGDETLFGQFEFLAVGYQHFGRNLGLQLTQGFVQVNRQVFDGTARLWADDVRAPAVAGEAVVDAAG